MVRRVGRIPPRSDSSSPRCDSFSLFRSHTVTFTLAPTSFQEPKYNINLDKLLYITKRREFHANEWIDILINSCGLNPERMSRRQKLLYLCRCVPHELRKIDVMGSIRSRFALIDASEGKQGLSGRDQRAVTKVASGLLKLLYPNGQVNDDELAEVLEAACELRQRVRDQLHLMAPGEYEQIKLGVRIESTGDVISPHLLDADRVQKVALPSEPRIGEVVGLAVAGDRGCILYFEMQATRSNGIIRPLGSIQWVMRESIEAAAQYIRAKHDELGIPAGWQENYDIAVLATFMGVPKEGPSAGVTIVTGIVSALKHEPVRNDIAMNGEITIMGKVLPVGGIQQKVRAAYDAGIREVLLPVDNLKEAKSLPAYIVDNIILTPVDRIKDVLSRALVRTR